MKIKNIIASLLLTLGVGIGTLTTLGTNLATQPKVADAATGTRVINLKPSSNWKEADAWFDAWVWGGTTADAWYTFGDSNGDLIYDIVIPSDRTGMKILRKNPASLSHGWSSWAQTGDISINSSTFNCLSNTEWGTSFTWSTISTDTRADLYLSGAVNNWEKNEDYVLFKTSEGWTRDFDLPAASEFKINIGNWDLSFGAKRFNANSNVFSGTDNVNITSDGTYRITLPLDMLNPNNKATITSLDNNAVIKEFVDTYMDFDKNPHNPDPTAEVNMGNECNTLYANVKEALAKLTPNQKAIFKTYDNGNAFARLKAWAIANGETIDETTLSPRSSDISFNLIRIQDNLNPIVLIIIALSVLSFTFVLIAFLRKKRN